MKQKKISDILLIILFCGFLGIMLLGYLFFPKEGFSESEKRYLATPPRLNWDNLASGEFAEDAETYAADHILFRNFFVGLNAYYDALSGRQASKDIFIAKDGSLLERPQEVDETAIERNMQAISDFADTVGQDVDLMLIPSAGYVKNDQLSSLYPPYQDQRILQLAGQYAGERVKAADVFDVLLEHKDEDIFYHTDHHWTSYGAYLAYCDYLSSKGKTPVEQDAFSITRSEGFYGSTYSRSALWLTAPDTLEIWDSGAKTSVYILDNQRSYDSMFFLERLQQADQYTVFLDGNHSLVRIHNDATKGQGKLLIIRDSFSNSLGPFLALNYEDVVLVDLRYYKESISDMVKQEGFDDILVEYSVNNFVSDENIVFLQ